MAGETITFDASSSHSPNGNITSYTWNFGDGNETMKTQPFINHTYSEPKIYNVTLEVIDEVGFKNLTSSLINVTYRTDINKDLKVDIVDVSTAARAFGAREGEERYDQRSDIDANKKIDMKDISKKARDFGKELFKVSLINLSARWLTHQVKAPLKRAWDLSKFFKIFRQFFYDRRS
ncbi:hypothetical protein DRP04_12915 [Archaeoglobales archaeon]|nr:MAG: hypothetical protein DRP04_12915 [Archaeoglobales archaeon]